MPPRSPSSLCSFPEFRNQVSNSFTTIGKITVLYILILTSVDAKVEDNILDEKQQAFRKRNLLSIRQRYVRYISHVLLKRQHFYAHVYNCCFTLTPFHRTQKPIVIKRYVYSTAALICDNIVTVDVTTTKCTTNIYIQYGQYAVPLLQTRQNYLAFGGQISP